MLPTWNAVAYKSLLKSIGCSNVTGLQEKNKHHHRDPKQKNKITNQSKYIDDGDKGIQ
jgi:hypothetical protein